MSVLLSPEKIIEIAILFLDGDDFEEVLLDQMGHTDYDFDKFNRLKAVLLKVEQLAPELNLGTSLWYTYPTNNRIGAALIAGSTLPLEGCKRQYLGPEIRNAFMNDCLSEKTRVDGVRSLFAPLKNSQDDIVGVLELMVGLKEKKDVSCKDMFVVPREEEDEED